MSIRIAAFALLLAPQALFAAEGSTAFVRGGLSSVGFEQNDSPRTYSLKADDGGGLNLSGGLRLDNGFALRADFVGSSHDGGRLCVSGLGCGNFDDDIDVGEGRLVFLWAPQLSEHVMLEVGGGFESISADTGDVESKIGGIVLEGSLVFPATEVWTFNVGLALMSLEDDDTHEDVTGGEFRAGVIADVGPVEIGAMLRGLGLEQDDDDSSSTIETGVGELRLTIGGSWGL